MFGDPKQPHLPGTQFDDEGHISRLSVTVSTWRSRPGSEPTFLSHLGANPPQWDVGSRFGTGRHGRSGARILRQ